MQLNRTLEQQIAVFGGSGSGKTVMLSSFYGAAQEPQFRRTSPFFVLADAIGQGNRLHRNYLGMRDSARRPEPTHFSATSYSFTLRLRDGSDAREMRARPFDALRLVWHDYPGEWFEQDVSGPEEAQRRVDAFRSLLGSDVALLLVDGQRLLDNHGEEERYLRSLLSNFRNGLLLLKDDLLTDGRPLVQFPRIWIVALSKADLLPNLNVFNFRDLVIEKASEDLDELRDVLEGLVEASDALSVGEDFMLLSSAKFDADKIEVTKRVGLDLILPLAAMLPFVRHVRWSQARLLPSRVAENLLGGAGVLAAVLLGRKVPRPGAVGLVLGAISAFVSREVLEDAVSLAGNKLKEINSEAVTKHDYLTVTLTGFRMALDKGEEDEILLRSSR